MTEFEPSSDTVKVYDTWVKGKHGTLHFDVMTTDQDTALKLAQAYLAGIGEGDATVSTRECQFCHSEPLVFFSEEQQQQFKEQGGFILRLPA